MKIEIRNVDRKIWAEVSHLIPEKVFDFHIHSFTHSGFIGEIPELLRIYLSCDINSVLNNIHLILANRKISGLITGWPSAMSDLRKQNDYIASSADENDLFFLILTNPQLDQSYLETIIKKKRCIGFKPYKCFAKNPEEARITDYMSHEQLEIANHFGFVITLHLSRKAGISDQFNIEDLSLLAERYPSIIWNLAHCGRSFIPDYLENSIKQLSHLKKMKIYFDTSAVNDNEVFTIIFSEFGPEKVLYGSDVPVSLLRGRCVGFGYDWAFIAEETHKISASFPVSPALVVYEELKAMKKAFKRLNFSIAETEKIFFKNAIEIVQEIANKKKEIRY
ncbi:MAG: amidohydrolase [Candidatus Omnitrophica bacterium]|nr:amidohydrolase [Candidatus Omnitrophota bacterium]MCM8789380.1 amidohydrolase [Candidatus Omnitrophota bacterium]